MRKSNEDVTYDASFTDSPGVLAEARDLIVNITGWRLAVSRSLRNEPAPCPLGSPISKCSGIAKARVSVTATTRLDANISLLL